MAKKNEVRELSMWFWTHVWKRQMTLDQYRDPSFRMLLGQASHLLKEKGGVRGLDPSTIRRTLEEMMVAGINPKNLYAIEWTAPSGVSWYEYVKSQDPKPPVYEQLALREYLQEHDPDSPLLAVL